MKNSYANQFSLKLSRTVIPITMFFIFISALSTIFLLYLHFIQLAILIGTGCTGMVLGLYCLKSSSKTIRYSLNWRYFTLIELALFLIAINILNYQRFPPIRPPVFYLVISIIFGFLGVESIFSNRNKFTTHIIIYKSILVSYFFKFTFYQSIYLKGGDTILHLERANKIFQTGFVSSIQGGYSTHPFFHVLWAIIGNVLELSAHESIFIIILFSSSAPIFVHIIIRELTADIVINRMAPIIAAAFPLLQRVYIQTESIALPILIPLLIYFLLSNIDRKNIVILTSLIYLSLLYTHSFYSLLGGLSAIIIWGLSILHGNRVFKTSAVMMGITIGWISNILTVGKFHFLIINIYEIISAGMPSTGKISPTHLVASPSPLQFLLIHLTELTLGLSLLVTGIIWLNNYNPKKTYGKNKNIILWSSFIIILITFIAIFVEGQRKIAMSVGFRMAYLVSIFLVVLGSVGLIHIIRTVENPIAIGVITFVIIAAVCGAGLASQQSNKTDPVLYAGEVRSPKLVTEERITTLDNFFKFVPEDSLILSDQLATRKNLQAIPGEEPFNVTQFNNPNLDKLSNRHTHLIINSLFEKYGMKFNNVRGYKHNKSKLKNYKIKNDKIWTSGQLEVFYHK